MRRSATCQTVVPGRRASVAFALLLWAIRSAGWCPGQVAPPAAPIEGAASQPASMPSAQERERAARPVAELFLSLLFEGQFEDAVGLTGGQLRNDLVPGQLADLMTNVGTSAGRLQPPVFASAAPTPAGHTEVVYRVPGELFDLRVSVVVSAADEVVGFGFSADERTLPWNPPHYASTLAFTESEQTVGREPWVLGATLSLPRGEGPFPGVVLVHGSGPNTRDQQVGINRIFKDLAWGLATRGIAVLRYDKRSKVHGARMKQLGAGLDSEVIDDALEALTTLRSQGGVDGRRTFLLGHTLGATLAPQIAQRDGRLAGVIMLAPAARPVVDIFLAQSEYHARRAGGDPEARRRLRTVRNLVEQIRNRAVPPGEEVFGVSATYWYDLSSRDGPRAVAAARDLSCPILLLHAGRDAELTGDDFGLWQEALGERPSATLKRFDKLNHLFLSGEGPFNTDEYQIPGHVDQDVIDEISRWVKSLGERQE